MAEYHVECSPVSNIIYAGKIKPNGAEWSSKNDVTDEAIEAVRDHLYALSKEGKSSGYEWTRKDGKKVQLLINIVDAEAFNKKEVCKNES